jgi:hypothetical protein
MPHQTFKIRPGVEVNETPVLNQAAIAECNLIRFKPDAQGLALVEKLGGWTRFSTLPTMPSVPRALWAWEDLNKYSWLAIGMESNPPPSGPSTLAVFSPASQPYKEITPSAISNDVVVNFATTAGSPVVTIADSTALNVTTFDSVYITEQVSIGGLVLYGLYPVYAFVSLGHFQIVATDIFGKPKAALTTVAAPGGAVPLITTTSGTAFASVYLAGHGYTVGSVFPVLVATFIGGVSFLGEYVVYSVQDADHFTIQMPGTATSSVSGWVNNGKIRLVYGIGLPPPSPATGYGVGGYGLGGYGTGQATPVNPGVALNAYDWALDNWGAVLLASPEGAVVSGIPVSGIYQWTPNTGQPIATIIPQAPPVNDGFFVAMPQRQIVAWGSSFTGVQDPLLIRWCDINDYTTWVGTVTNQAGSYRLTKGSKIVGALQTSQQALIWTDLAVWSMQYISQPYVYGFNEISTGCGLLAQKGCGTLFGVTYWISQSQFFKLDGNGVTPIPCPIWDVIFQNLNPYAIDRIRCATNSQFNEVSWFYSSKNSGGENDSYVKYNTVMGVWDYGQLPRSAWINQNVLGPPLAADPVAKVIYQHETSPDADLQPMTSWFKTGFFALSDADVKTFIDEVWPDMKWGYYGSQPSATVQLSFNVKDFPSQRGYTIGPFNLTFATDYISPRVRGRLVQIELLSSDIGTFWRLGGLRYRGSPDGRY